MALFIELVLMGVGLAMDAFAVSICKGLGMSKLNKKQALIIGLYFGGFQALMPFVGWLLGSQFQQYITSIDHWIAFILLTFIGGKMMLEAIREWNEEEIVEVKDALIDHKNMLMLAVATSIDALSFERENEFNVIFRASNSLAPKFPEYSENILTYRYITDILEIYQTNVVIQGGKK